MGTNTNTYDLATLEVLSLARVMYTDAGCGVWFFGECRWWGDKSPYDLCCEGRHNDVKAALAQQWRYKVHE